MEFIFEGFFSILLYWVDLLEQVNHSAEKEASRIESNIGCWKLIVCEVENILKTLSVNKDKYYA